MFKSLWSKLHTKIIDWLVEEPPQNEVPPYDFDRLIYEIRPCDVLLIEGRSRISRVIRSITQSPWTHAALYIGRLSDIEDEELRKILKEHGIEKENTRIIIEGIINRGTVASSLATYRSTHIRICRPIGLSAADANVIISYAIKSLGNTYSVKHIIDLGRFFLPWSILPSNWGSRLFRTPTGEPEGGVCSSLIAEAFSIVQFPVLPFVEQNDKTGLELTQRNPYLYTPKDFDYSPYFEIIKYPLFNPEEPLPYYRRLPWTKENVVYQDSYGKYTRSEGRLVKKEKTTEKSEENIEEKPAKPESPDNTEE